MKRYMILLVILGTVLTSVYANTREDVSLARCTDGDTAHFYIQGEDVTVRFLAINAPEYTKEKEPYGKEASEYVCDALRSAESITLEYDDGSTKSDKYGRTLAWVFVDGMLLQEDLVEKGLAEVAYIYGNYAYTDRLKAAQERAKAQKIAMWSDGSSQEEIPYYMTIMGGVLCIAAGLLFYKGNKRRRLVRKGIRTIIKKKGA